MDELQEMYKKAMSFAAAKHDGQLLPGTTLPYLVHVTNVTMEVMIAGSQSAQFDLPYATAVALLHDTIEDTKTVYKEVAHEFGNRVADAVLALTKFSNIPKDEQIRDSVRRIKCMPKEVWAVKLADRITNLQAPPLDWDYKKRKKYMCDAEMIYDELKEGNHFLSRRLADKIVDYQQFVYIGEK